MNETFEYIKTFARFPFGLRGFLEHPLTPEQAQRIVRERMAHRAENFLRIIQDCVYGYPRSPYLPMLKTAGCELGDLRALVHQKGVEGALHELRQAGVYVTFEEFKGRQPLIRGGTTIPVKSSDWDNPSTRRAFTTKSGGSTGNATSVSQDFTQLSAQTAHRILTLSAWNVLYTPTIFWRGIFPDSTLKGILQDLETGNIPRHWFSHLGRNDSAHWFKYTLATYYMVMCIRLFRPSAPFPVYTPPDQADRVARALADTLKTDGRCLLRTSVSRALRVCLVAEKAGISLQGLTISGGGEPVTPAKIRAIEKVGARFLANYALTEAGTLGNGCAQPAGLGDLHLFSDAFALITFPYQPSGLDVTVSAFSLTTLLPFAPKVLLNLQMDDYGIVEERQCGCELGQYGYTTHLREIRSYSKLVGEGVTLIGNEMLHVLEEVLPTRFGGSPLDYQLMEEEDSQGFTRLYLIIHPNVQIADESAVINVVLNALRNSSPMGDSARVVWQQTRALEIKRRVPILTGRGKLLPLHLARNTDKK